MIQRRRVLGMAGVLALAAAAFTAPGAVTTAMADSPSGPYDVTPQAPATYSNTTGVVGWPDPSGPPAPACSSTMCDRQTINLSAGSSPVADQFSLTVTVTYTSTDTTMGNCLDIAIEDASASTAYASANCVPSGGHISDPNIAAGASSPGTPYTIEVDADAANGAIVQPQPFTVHVSASASTPAAQPTPTPTSAHPFNFTHEVSVDVQRGDGEPDLAVADNGQDYYSAAPYGFSTTVSLMWKSADAGVQWTNLHGASASDVPPCPNPVAVVLRPDCSRGGGDAEIQLSQPGTMNGPQRVQFEDLNGLDSISCAYSDNGGDTFTDLPAFVASGNPVPGTACDEGGTVPSQCLTVPPPTSTCGVLGTDRQWVQVWPKADQPPGATSDILYMTFDTGDQPPSGDAAIFSPDNGVHWSAACTTLTGSSCLGGPNGVGSRPGPLVINPTLLNTVHGVSGVTDGTYPTLYEFMGTNSNGTEVNISCDGGQTWSHVPTSNGMVGSTTNDFVVGSIDSNGEVYTAYSVSNDPNPWRVWFNHSTDTGGTKLGDCSVPVPGGKWATPTPLTGAPSTADGVGATPIPSQNYAVMPWLTAGSGGRVDVVYYATDKAIGYSPDTDAAYWYLHMAQTLDGGATWTDEQATEQPMHSKSICFSGIGCTAQTPPGGDRNLLDFFQVKTDSTGRAIIIFTDDNNTAGCAPTCSPGIGLISEVQQVSGPSLYSSAGGGTGLVNGVVNPYLQQYSLNGDIRQAGFNADVTDPNGDALLAGPGHNLGQPQTDEVPAADITDLKVCLTHTSSCPVANTTGNTAAFLFTLSSLSGGPGSAVQTSKGQTSANWLVTWRSNNDLWFAQATTDALGNLSCIYGRPLSVYNDGEPKLAEYVDNPETVALPSSSCVANTSNNTIEIDVPFGAMSGLSTTSTLYGLTGWTGNSTAAIPSTLCDQAAGGTACSGPLGYFNNIDETAPLDVVLVAPQNALAETPYVPLLLGLGGAAMLGGTVVRRRRRRPAV